MVRVSANDVAKDIATELQTLKLFNPDKQMFEVRCYTTRLGEGFIEVILHDKVEKKFVDKYMDKNETTKLIIPSDE